MSFAAVAVEPVVLGGDDRPQVRPGQPVEGDVALARADLLDALGDGCLVDGAAVLAVPEQRDRGGDRRGQRKGEQEYAAATPHGGT